MEPRTPGGPQSPRDRTAQGPTGEWTPCGPRTGRCRPSPWHHTGREQPSDHPRGQGWGPHLLGTGEGPGDLLGDLLGPRPPREVGWPSSSRSPEARRGASDSPCRPGAQGSTWEHPPARCPCGPPAACTRPLLVGFLCPLVSEAAGPMGSAGREAYDGPSPLLPAATQRGERRRGDQDPSRPCSGRALCACPLEGPSLSKEEPHALILHQGP